MAELMKQIQEKAENKMAGDSGKKSKDKTDPKDGKAEKSRLVSPGDKYPSNGAPGPSGPPVDPPDHGGPPPRFPPSWRGSTYADDNMSQSNVTVADAPRVSRREADKITVGPWPKIQDVETWKSDVVKSVILAANDGDRAAWQDWILPAIADNPDLDALSDSGGSRFQSIDTKLSIALTSVINQAGEAGRDVQMLLRHRTQAAGRRASFVMGREILAMILTHFKTPGLRNTLFTMEHIVKMQYFGDSQLDQFFHKWMEMCSNMLPEDVPQDNWLRDCLYKKIRHSILLLLDIKQYESWDEGDYRRTYRHLRNVIERAIARVKEDKQSAARDKYARDYAGSGKPTTPAPATPTPKAGQDATPAPKAKRNRRPSRSRRLMPLLFYLRHNQNNTPRAKAKGKGLREVPVDLHHPV